MATKGWVYMYNKFLKLNIMIWITIFLVFIVFCLGYIISMLE